MRYKMHLSACSGPGRPPNTEANKVGREKSHGGRWDPLVKDLATVLAIAGTRKLKKPDHGDAKAQGSAREELLLQNVHGQVPGAPSRYFARIGKFRTKDESMRLRVRSEYREQS